MNPSEIKTKWLEALRSRRYPQGTGSLRNENGYCCLGVLLDVVDKYAWSSSHRVSVYAGKSLWKGEANFPPAKIQIQLNFPPNLIRELSILNDVEKYSFHQIADVIEARWNPVAYHPNLDHSIKSTLPTPIIGKYTWMPKEHISWAVKKSELVSKEKKEVVKEEEHELVGV